MDNFGGIFTTLSQTCKKFHCLKNGQCVDSGGNVVQQHFSEKLKKQGVLGRKLPQRLFQIVPRFGEIDVVDEGKRQCDLRLL